MLTSALLAGIIYSTSTQVVGLTQIYALVAITYLYIALLATPLTRLFVFLPFRGQYIKARRAIGVSAFFFSLLHAGFAFFGKLGGFAGLGFLDSKYLLAVGFSFLALVILSLLSLTSFDYMVSKLTFPRWKFLHRFVYLAGILIVMHALLLGSHFTDLSGIIPRVFFAAFIVLFGLEAIRIYNYFKKR